MVQKNRQKGNGVFGAHGFPVYANLSKSFRFCLDFVKQNNLKLIKVVIQLKSRSDNLFTNGKKLCKGLAVHDTGFVSDFQFGLSMLL